MTCDREKLSHYVDGELEPDEVRQLQQHLAECEQCTADLAIYRGVNDTIGRLGQERAPSELRRQIYHWVEEQRRSQVRWGWAAPLLRPAVPVTLGVFMLAGGVAAWRVLLPPGSAPVMTAAFAVQATPDSLDGLRVELVFDRPVAADSVARAITIEPPLPISQRVHENKVELIPDEPIQPGTSYRVTVSNVRDQRGNVQTAPVVFNLSTAPVAMLSQESSPAPLQPAAPAAAAPRAEPTPTTVAAALLAEPTVSAVATAPPTAVRRETAAVATAAPTATAGARATATAAPVAPPVAAALSPATPTTASAPALTPTGQPTPAGTAMAALPTPTIVASAAASSPRPAVTPTTAPPDGSAQAASAGTGQPRPTSATGPTVSASPLATMAPAPDSSAVALVESNPELKRRLGEATGPERSVRLVEQSFQGGIMLGRGDTDRIYALVRSSGRYESFANSWRPGEVLPPAGQRPPGTFEPLRGFGKIWRNEPSVKLQLGWPAYEERAALGTLQPYSGGTLIRSAGGIAYALLDDSTWRVLPDPR